MIERVTIHVKDEVEGKALHPIISEIMDSCFDPGYSQAWFAHDLWHIWYVLDGRAHVGLDGDVATASPGDMYLIPGGVPHSLVIPGPEPCRVFDAKFTFAGSDSQTQPTIGGHLHDEFGVKHLIARILSELSRQAPAWETAVRGIFNEVVGEVMRRFSLPTVESPWPESVKDAISYIEENYHHRIQLEDVAAHVAFSPKYLAILFKKATGYTIREYITRARVERAKWYLSHSEITINEIADLVGYSSIYYFSRLFRATVGVPPSVYRRHHRLPDKEEMMP